MKHSRRGFLRRATGLLGTVALPGCSGSDETRLSSGQGLEPEEPQPPPTQTLRQAVAAYFGTAGLAAARQVGDRYLQLVEGSEPPESRSSLRRALSDLQLALDPTMAPEGHVIWLRQRMDRDFEAERIVRIDGWRLARSEVLLATWASQLDDAPLQPDAG